jgi:flagellar biosynthetic protein FlhB
MALDDQERTEQATPKRREEARKRGQVARSVDLASAGLILGSALALFFMGPMVVARSRETIIQAWTTLSTEPITQQSLFLLMQEGMGTALAILLPIVVFLSGAGILSHVLQYGLLWAPEQLAPELSRIDPIEGFKRIFSVRALVNFVKTIFKFSLLATVTYYVIRGQMPAVVTSIQMEPQQMIGLAGALMGRLVIWSGLVIFILGIVDYAFERWEHERRLKMSRQELREEFKQTEGDPLLRARIRTIQREMARKRMMAEVPKADVVVVNPTALAVVLLYRKDEMEAPKVVAKGAGLIAQKIREIAREHNVPLVENKPVARALYRSVKVGAQVPSQFYRVVAEILAYVYRMRAKIAGPPAERESPAFAKRAEGVVEP